MRSDVLIQSLSSSLQQLAAMPITTHGERVEFVRKFILRMNELMFELRAAPETLNAPQADHPDWRRHTQLLAIWDDYAVEVIGISFDAGSIERLARVLVAAFAGVPAAAPKARYPSGLLPEEFGLIRLAHATQDFTELLPPIDSDLVERIRSAFDGQIPTAAALALNGKRFVSALGGADSNVDERIRYVQEVGNKLTAEYGGEFQRIFSDNSGDVTRILTALQGFPGIKSKKAHMLLRDFYVEAIWSYQSNIDAINIIADNRIMRVALRTGILRLRSGRLVSSLLDQYDLQYVAMVRATEEVFRRVWAKCRELNGGNDIVPFPGGLDAFLFALGDGRSGCCRLNTRSCETGKPPKKFYKWMEAEMGYKPAGACPLMSVCEAPLKKLNSPYAIQNNTWNGLYSNEGGGGGLRGI